MASRIQGITVEIGGDTTKLSKALESVNKSIKGTQSGLKDVNKLLKLDPSNTELVVQNQKMLKDAIEATKEKLASPFSCLNNFYFKILSSFLGSLHFLLAAGIFRFFRQFSISFRIFHFLPIHKIRKRGYQIQQIQFAMQKAASNTHKTITVSHSAIRHFLARLHSLVAAVAAGISVALTVLTTGAAATAIASKYGHFGVKLVNKRDFGDDRYGYGMICEN